MDNGFASLIVAAVAEPALPAALADRAGLLSARQQGRRKPDSLPSRSCGVQGLVCRARQQALARKPRNGGEDPSGRGRGGRLTSRTVGNLVKRYVAAGLIPTALGTHSLRGSYITSVASAART